MLRVDLDTDYVRAPILFFFKGTILARELLDQVMDSKEETRDDLGNLFSDGNFQSSSVDELDFEATAEEDHWTCSNGRRRRF